MPSKPLFLFLLCGFALKIPVVCLDSSRAKPLTYKQIIVANIKELTLPSRIESVDQAALEAEKFAQNAGLDEEFRSAIDMAVRESVANAVKHGNKFDDTKQVEIKFSRLSEGFEIIVRDFGPGFEHEDIPDPTKPDNLMKVSGRGILFMRAFMDEVEWSNHAGGGLVVKMLKKQ